MTMSNHMHENGPFASQQPNRITVSLGMLLLSMFIFAAISTVIMLAARVPIIANSLNEFFGLPQSPKSDKPDRTTHLLFLLFCYTSPLLLATWLGLLHSAREYLVRRTENPVESPETTNPLA
ncbi:MAG: hypothetical protein ABL921_20785 [Pirellula sp.]